jgi:serine/threonine protein phosphatase 1
VFSKWLKKRAPEALPVGAVPPGQRVYAIGDVHGRDDLLGALLEQIERDDAGRGAAQTQLIFLGDLVDRGPASAQVIDRVMALAQRRAPGTTRFLLGNHEEVLLTTLDGDMNALKFFYRIGGRETLLSYGVSAKAYDESDYEALMELTLAHVPPAHREFITRFEDIIDIGDYLFVHAGVDPDQPLAEQKPADLRWIRKGFLDFNDTLPKVIVHGHTIADEVEQRPHRIGLDTGAYATGRLTAMGFEGSERWILQAVA